MLHWSLLSTYHANTTHLCPSHESALPPASTKAATCSWDLTFPTRAQAIGPANLKKAFSSFHDGNATNLYSLLPDCESIRHGTGQYMYGTCTVHKLIGAQGNEFVTSITERKVAFETANVSYTSNHFKIITAQQGYSRHCILKKFSPPYCILEQFRRLVVGGSMIAYPPGWTQ